MRVVEIIREGPDPWYGNNQDVICQDDEGRYWFCHNNDAYAKDHPDYMKKVKEVKPVQVIKTEWHPK